MRGVLLLGAAERRERQEIKGQAAIVTKIRRRRWVIRFAIRPFFIFVLLSSVIALTGPVPVFAQESTIRVTQSDGSVTLNGKTLREGDLINRDDRIETKAGSSAVLTWSNGSIVEIYPDSVLTLKGVMYEGDRKLETSLLTLEKGRIFAKAQVPEHLFSHFEIGAAGAAIMTQGAEFAVKYEDVEKKITTWSLIGGVIVDISGNRMKVDEGQMAVLKIGAKFESPMPIPDKTKEGLSKTSKRLGGSLLVEEELASGGPLKIKIGGVKNRRGNSPYTVKFRAAIGGGSGKVKSIRWDFGDGESSFGKEAQHTFTQGVYAVVLTVEDENGQKATAQLNISVEESCGC